MKVSNKKKLNKEIFNYLSGYKSKKTIVKPKFLSMFLKLIKNDKIFINFVSKSFLQKQVRSMVGCLKYVGENKWSPNKIRQLIKSKRRDQCAPPAPPEGLFLKKIYY